MEKKILIGYVDRHWRNDFIERWGVFQFPYTRKLQMKPIGQVKFDNIKVKITIEEIK